ncbi:MAG TPA: SPOR domain-containing protein [Gammaproteobacteria bacterium]|nr:SPOR domain-containing protein [Gammaproteobacteria bacterium]
MDRSLKERLVGAAVLVAIGAWLIPWVLDGPERVEAPQSTALELPAPSAENPPIRTETIVLDRRDSPVPREPEPNASEPSAPQRSEPAAAIAAPPATAAASPAPPAAREEPAAQPVASAAAAGAADTQRAAQTTDDSAVAAGEARWYVQLGAFGDRGNADRLAARVGTYGYRAHVSEFPSSGRTVYRVRVGPEASRGRAESIASALSAHSFVAQVVPE